MSLEYKVEIISPDKTIFSGNSDEVVLPCFEGQVTVLKDHIPLITFLRPGLIQIGVDNKFYVEEGTVVASKCENEVAGAGSVRSSAGTYIA